MTQILQPCEKQQKMVFQLPTNHLLMLHTKLWLIYETQIDHIMMMMTGSFKLTFKQEQDED